MTRRRVVIVAVLASLFPATASADPVSGTLERGPGDNALRAELRNDGSGADEFLRIELAGGTEVDAVTTEGCSPAGNTVRCGFGDTWTPGRKVVIDFTTRARYGTGAGADAFVCPRPCAGRDSGPFHLAGPSDAAPGGADLEATVALEPPDRFRLILFGEDERGSDAAIAVQNHGPDVAESVTVLLSVDEAPSDLRVRGAANCSTQGGRAVLCSAARLGVGETAKFRVRLRTEGFGALRVTAAASAATRDPGPRPNTATAETTITAMHSSIGSIGFERWEGTAPGAARVEVAITRETQGARPYAPSCQWLTRRGTFRRERGRRCDDPVWLRARGTRRWSLRLPRRLPRGRYTALSRAIRGEVAETGFVRGENLREFVIRRRR